MFYRAHKLEMETDVLGFPDVLMRYPFDAETVDGLNMSLLGIRASLLAGMDSALGSNFFWAQGYIAETAEEHHKNGKHLLLSADLAQGLHHEEGK